MSYSLFLGCTIPTRQMNYEQSAREVAKVLGIEFIDDGYGCCGFPLEPIDEIKALAMAAANLQKAAESGRDVIALCSACGGQALVYRHARNDHAVRAALEQPDQHLARDE